MSIRSFFLFRVKHWQKIFVTGGCMSERYEIMHSTENSDDVFNSGGKIKITY